MNPETENLVLEGGGARGLAYAGVLERLPLYVDMNRLRRYAGTSAGAIVAFLLSIGCPPVRLKLLMEEFNRDIVCPRQGPLRRLWNLRKGYGWYSTQRLREWLSEILIEQIPEVLTHRQFALMEKLVQITGHHLYVVAFNAKAGKPQYFSGMDTPTYSAVEAVIHSMSIPGYFSAPMSQALQGIPSTRYTDGGLVMNYPISLFDTWQDGERLANTATLGVRLDSSAEIEAIQAWRTDPGQDKQTAGDMSAKSFVFAHLNALINRASSAHLSEKDWRRTIFVDCGHVGSLDFDLSAAEKEFLYESGQIAVEEFFAGRHPAGRHSAKTN